MTPKKAQVTAQLEEALVPIADVRLKVAGLAGIVSLVVTILGIIASKIFGIKI